MNSKHIFTILIPLLLIACSQKNDSKTSEMVSGLVPIFVGTYTRDEGFVNGLSDGIQLMMQNEETGELSKPSLAFEIINPSFLARHPNGKVLYAVSELNGNDGPTGFLYSLSVGEDFTLAQVSKVETGAIAPCHVSVDKTGKYVFVANYVGGVVKMYSTAPTGELAETDRIQLEGSGSDPRQEASHTHMVIVSPDNKFLYIPDLGANKVWCFVIDIKNGKLLPAEIPFTEIQPGAGPRHLDFHPNGLFAYVINELDATINAYAYDSLNGGLDSLQSVPTLPDGFERENTCAEIQVHPSGKYLYGSNRGHDSLVIYTIDQESGLLSLIGHQPSGGEAPRNFTIDKKGRFLYAANQNSDNVVVFSVDEDGSLLKLGEKLGVKTPVCLTW